MAVLLDVSIPPSQPAISNTPAIVSLPSLLSDAQLSPECLVSIVQVVRASNTAEPTPLIVHQQCIRCYADYVSYAAWYLFQCVGEHKNLTISEHFHEAHSKSNIFNEGDFKILRKCQGQFDCLLFEKLYIKKFKPDLNVQADSICAKLFV